MSNTEEHEQAMEALVTDKPVWVTGELSFWDVQAIQTGGCESGAYMPAVTYYDALETMNKHGDDVLDYLQDNLGELPAVPADTSWSGIAVFYLSTVVDLWAHSVELPSC